MSDPSRAPADGGPEMIQLLTPEGVRVHDAPEDIEAIAQALSPETLRGLYHDLVLLRRFDSEGTALQRQGELGLWASLRGQEASQIGCGRAMRAQDVAFPGYREHGIAWCRGIPPVRVMGLFRGTDRGAWAVEEYNFHNYTIVIGNQAPVGVGYAMGVQRDGAVGTGEPDRDTAVVIFMGDGATAQGDNNEGFVFAAVNDAPVVFFCQNNQWAISEPNIRQTKIPIYQRARGFGFPGVRVDGNDILAVYAVTTAMLDRARSGTGPSLIEAFTYRMGAHTTSDDPTKYRVSAEVEMWKLKDPIERYKAWLAHEGLGEGSWFREVDEEADAMAAELRTQVLAIPDPPVDDIFDHVYLEPHQQVREHQQALHAYLDSFEPEQVAQ